MDATPSFGVIMIPEVPSNPQLTLTRSIHSAHTEYKRAGSVLEAVPEEMGTVTAPGEMENVTNETSTTQFHIPESNVSDVAPSECSSYHRHGKIFL